MHQTHTFEHSVSRSRAKHAGESSQGLCDRLSRTRDSSQRQLPTDHDYAVPTREYQTDQSSLYLTRLQLALCSKNLTTTTPLLRVDRSLHISPNLSSRAQSRDDKLGAS